MNTFRIKKRFFIIFFLLGVLPNVMIVWDAKRSSEKALYGFASWETLVAYEALLFAPFLYSLISKLVVSSEKITYITGIRRWEVRFSDISRIDTNLTHGGFHILKIHSKNGTLKTIDFTYYHEGRIRKLIEKALQKK